MISCGKLTVLPEDVQVFPEVDLLIGSFCSIGSGFKIYSGLHPTVNNPAAVSQFPFREVASVDYFECVKGGQVSIGNDVWIASEVRILTGVSVGDGAIIAAGSVVTKDIPPYTFVAGNPAEVKYMRFSHSQIQKLLSITWWEWEYDKIKTAVPFMKDVQSFIDKYFKE
jgi:virginiamycin A acetyltransferase